MNRTVLPVKNKGKNIMPGSPLSGQYKYFLTFYIIKYPDYMSIRAKILKSRILSGQNLIFFRQKKNQNKTKQTNNKTKQQQQTNKEEQNKITAFEIYHSYVTSRFHLSPYG